MTHYLYIGAKTKLPDDLKQYGSKVSEYKWKTTENRYEFQYELYYELGLNEFNQVVALCRNHLKENRYDTIEVTNGLNSNRYPMVVSHIEKIHIDQLTGQHLQELRVDGMYKIEGNRRY
ncbi:hypothetical protein [Macrococcus bovicus]|uniref:Uncharacterized protein n=1 Tax=Macrococcus bovicus TaxID=69968 RepID=A0A4R6C0E0_9STAP|nr:hypothetical protein [Macrococcus bovicus]TDM14416.1 hypothetical protein ERX55_05655 [Macrococcus bovicus]